MEPSNPYAMGTVPGTTWAVDETSAYPIAGSTGIAAGTGAGQHGVVSLFGNGGTVGEAVQDVWEWLNTPFSKPMSPTGIFALVGSVVVAILLWNLILYHIRIAAETI
jgi:hypothetical protein